MSAGHGGEGGAVYPHRALLHHMEQAWSLDCSRCANVGTTYEPTGNAAAADLWVQGWRLEGPEDLADVYCPACMNHRADQSQPTPEALRGAESRSAAPGHSETESSPQAARGAVEGAERSNEG